MFVSIFTNKFARLTISALVAFVLAFAMLPNRTVHAAPMTVRATTTLNVRSGPSTDSAIVTVLSPGDSFEVVDTVAGEEVLAGNASWFQTANGNFVYAGFTSAGDGATASSDGLSGRWIEVDRSAQIARAIEDGQVVYTAPVTVGVQSFPTPVGSFTILRRVANETMDSSTIGIPSGSPGGYFLENVLFTQYITNDGVALHYNYWSPPEAFGNYPGSHGCIGLRLADAEFFWNFASIGTPVIITN